MSTVTKPRTATQRWVVDPDRSTVEFRVKHLWGQSTTVGHFSRFEGTYTTGRDGRAIQLTIDADSLDTGNGCRDRHLRAEDFFEIEAHPYVRFRASDVVDLGDGTLRVRGALEASGTEVPLEFDAAIHEVGDELELEATTSVDQRLFGMTASPLGMVQTPTTLHVKGRLTAASE